MMRRLLKRMLVAVVGNDRCWRLANVTLLSLARYLERIRRDGVVVPRAIRRVSPDLAVLHGPFRGMRYPRMASVGSALFPKIVGSYEQELHEVIERICAGGYSEIVDIGCAEGYYAVGLAMRLKEAQVYAFDTEESAVRLCREMAGVNGVEARMHFGGTCDTAALTALRFTKKALIVCDCEGYEVRLFTPETARGLVSHDLLVEVHGDSDVHLRGVFGATHDIEEVFVRDDIRKAASCEYPEMKAYSFADRLTLLGELRINSHGWLFIRAKT